ncbi:MAG: glutamine synthetase, partial [Candidatus Omnitrophota bacterium]
MIAKTKKDVLALVKKHDIKFIKLWFADVLGFQKGIAITKRELEKAMSEGMGFDGSSIEGFARIEESDMVAMPDASTFQLIPWRNDKE